MAGAIGVLRRDSWHPETPRPSRTAGSAPSRPTAVASPRSSSRKPPSNLIKANVAAPVVVTVSSTDGNTPLVGSTVGSSSRGPSPSLQPDQARDRRPGRFAVCRVRHRHGQTAFGGTSGAAPMVAGAAALVLSARPDLTPMQVKALLMNSADTTVYVNPATQPGLLAPIARIGAGEVRVNRAIRPQGRPHWDHIRRCRRRRSYGGHRGRRHPAS